MGMVGKIGQFFMVRGIVSIVLSIYPPYASDTNNLESQLQQLLIRTKRIRLSEGCTCFDQFNIRLDQSFCDTKFERHYYGFLKSLSF